MTYFLGRDVKVAITTEDGAGSFSNTSGIAAVANAEAPDGTNIAELGGLSESQTDIITASEVMNDVTGVDVTLGTVDEDIAYFGQRTALKANIKKATTVSITRKRSSTDFNVLFNQARGGVRTFTDSNQTAESVDNVTGASNTAGVTANLAGIDNHDSQPDRNYGYRVHLMLKDGSEVMSIRNCCFQEYSISLNADAVQEETLVFYSLVDPVVAAAGTTAVVAESDF